MQPHARANRPCPTTPSHFPARFNAGCPSIHRKRTMQPHARANRPCPTTPSHFPVLFLATSSSYTTQPQARVGPSPLYKHCLSIPCTLLNDIFLFHTSQPRAGVGSPCPPPPFLLHHLHRPHRQHRHHYCCPHHHHLHKPCCCYCCCRSPLCKSPSHCGTRARCRPCP